LPAAEQEIGEVDRGSLDLDHDLRGTGGADREVNQLQSVFGLAQLYDAPGAHQGSSGTRTDVDRTCMRPASRRRQASPRVAAKARE